MRIFDGHLIIQNAEKVSNKEKKVVAQNSNKSITIGFDSLIVKDSFSFRTASLDKLPAGLTTALVVIHFFQNRKILNHQKVVFTEAK